jgi:hypothetical protein
MDTFISTVKFSSQLDSQKSWSEKKNWTKQAHSWTLKPYILNIFHRFTHFDLFEVDVGL